MTVSCLSTILWAIVAAQFKYGLKSASSVIELNKTSPLGGQGGRFGILLEKEWKEAKSRKVIEKQDTGRPRLAVCCCVKPTCSNHRLKASRCERGARAPSSFLLENIVVSFILQTSRNAEKELFTKGCMQLCTSLRPMQFTVSKHQITV